MVFFIFYEVRLALLFVYLFYNFLSKYRYKRDLIYPRALIPIVVAAIGLPDLLVFIFPVTV